MIFNFASDNAVGASALVMAALAEANAGPALAYGQDPWTARVEAAMSELFEREVAVALLATGTAANALALACITQPWGAVLTHEESHIADDECGAPEFFTNGAKLVGLAGVGSKLTPEVVTAQLARMPHGAVKQVQPQCLSITQATESGLVYRPAEIAALAAAIRPRGLALHMDGARFANAVVALGCSPADITWKAGVDVLSFGATKNGAWAAEAVVFFDPAKAEQMPWRRKRSGHTVSKGRFVAAQFEALLRNGHWLDLARQANRLAARLAGGLGAISGIRLGWACEANAVFGIMPQAMAASLRADGALFYDWSARSLPAGEALRPGEGIYRFVCSHATTEQEVDGLLAAARNLAVAG
ncbi:MAG: low specificity L-threonine aldolase [Beijerinckiaceae bacterium]|nr:low specificity L-threonine aldolase [Beijerinckiaceae bacterium]